MNLNDYQVAANKTAKYPSAEYPFMCLAEEMSELHGAFNRFKLNPSDETLDLVMKEAGDCAWEVAECCTQLGVKMDDLNCCVGLGGRSPDGYITAMIREAGEVTSVITKAMRKCELNAEDTIARIMWDDVANNCPRKASIMQHLGAFLLELAMFSDGHFAGGFNEALEANIEKLQGRVERGTICGSGDLR